MFLLIYYRMYNFLKNEWRDLDGSMYFRINRVLRRFYQNRISLRSIGFPTIIIIIVMHHSLWFLLKRSHLLIDNSITTYYFYYHDWGTLTTFKSGIIIKITIINNNSYTYQWHDDFKFSQIKNKISIVR